MLRLTLPHLCFAGKFRRISPQQRVRLPVNLSEKFTMRWSRENR
jgi:hypothetical protein